MIRFVTDHLPTHGIAPYYSWAVFFGRRFARLSVGGYKAERPVVRYRGIATHYSLGRYTLSFGRKVV